MFGIVHGLGIVIVFFGDGCKFKVPYYSGHVTGSTEWMLIKTNHRQQTMCGCN